MSPEQPNQILVVEDDADTRANLCDILELDGHGADTAATFAEAFSKAKASQPFAVILDRKLPDGTAEEQLPLLKALAPNAAVMVVTGYRDLEGAISCLRQGAEDYILKPINPDALRGALARIVEHKRTQRALQESEERFRLLVENVQDYAIFLLDPEGRVVSWNNGAQRIKGYSGAEIVGQHFSCFYPPQDIEAGKPDRELEAATTSYSYLDDAWRVRKDGSQFWASVMINALREGTERVRGYAVVTRDVTERRRLEKEILEISAREQRRIGQDLHDGLGQQLTGLGYLAKSLSQRLRARNAAECDNADLLTKTLQETLGQVRAIAKGLVPVQVDANGLMAALEDLATSTEEQCGVRCRFKRPQLVPVEDNEIAMHLFRIAQEATSNAIRHARPRRIAITLEATADHLILKTQDDGVGIQGKVEDATGLGLRIMRYRADLIGAALDIQSSAGQGTLVTCSL